jgi:hydrogenase nickel incorporation protein HypA/HybF
MHELTATRGLLDVALDAARGAGAGRITAIDVVVGDLTSIVDDSVQFYFDLLSRDTVAAGADLRFSRRAAEAVCEECEHRFPVTPPLPRSCPSCGSLRLAVAGGQEFYVESIEVDDEGSRSGGHPEGK